MIVHKPGNPLVFSCPEINKRIHCRILAHFKLLLCIGGAAVRASDFRSINRQLILPTVQYMIRYKSLSWTEKPSVVSLI